MNTTLNQIPSCPLKELKCGMIKLETQPMLDPPIYVCAHPDCELTLRALTDNQTT